MSPKNRSRKTKKSKRRRDAERATRRRRARGVPDTSAQCDCLRCTLLHLGRAVRNLLACYPDLAGGDDPLTAELAGAMFISAGAKADMSLARTRAARILALEAAGTGQALAMLLAIESITDGAGSMAAGAAADRLVAAGLPRPAWAAELAEPLTVADCCRLDDAEAKVSLLACSFHRAGRSHAIVTRVEHTEPGGASDIVLVAADRLHEVLRTMPVAGSETLGPAEFRRQVEHALDAHAVHDDESPTYPALAVLLRAQMARLAAIS